MDSPPSGGKRFRTHGSEKSNLQKKRKQLTDAQRRQLRASQRSLRETLETADLDEARETNNALFDSVLYTREAVLDSENVSLIASKYVQKVEQLIQVPRYDASKIIQKLASQCTTPSGFDWSLLGRECGICFNSVPSRVSVLSGVVDQGRPLRVRQQRTVQQTTEMGPQVEPEVVKKQEQDPNQLSATEKTLKQVKSSLKRVAAKEAAPGIPFLFNPKSFTQSVENIFHYSFLIKRAEASIAVEENQLCVQARKSGEGMSYQQAVVPLTMRDWRRLCRAMDVTESTIPHRKSGRSTQSSQLSQSST